MTETLKTIQAPEVLVGGKLLAERTFAEQAAEDAVFGESIALVVLAAVLVLFLGGIVAGLLPLAGALATIAGSLLVLNALAGVVAVSEFAVNVVTLLGLGLAADYSLLMVTRLTLIPALIAVAHRRIPAPGSRTWVWRRGRTPGPGLLARLAVFAQRRPAAVALTVTAALVAVSVPAFGLDAANADASSLPGSAEGSTRQRLPQAKRERVATSRALVRPAIHGSRRSS